MILSIFLYSDILFFNLFIRFFFFGFLFFFLYNIYFSYNIVYSIINMWFFFLFLIPFFILFKSEFIAVLILLLYVGALTVLFLYIIMFVDFQTDFCNQFSIIHINFFFILLLYFFLCSFFFCIPETFPLKLNYSDSFNNFNLIFSPDNSFIDFQYKNSNLICLNPTNNYSNLTNISFYLYLNFFFSIFLIGILLFIAIIAVIIFI